MWGDGISSEMVARSLEQNPGVKSIRVRINSPGGSAYDGMAIRSMLAAHPAEKVCEIEGLAASAGSIVAMGCGTIRMHTGSAMMVHEASARMPEGGNTATKLRQVIAGLETLNDGMASVYSERTGISKKECRSMMAAETWLTPDQAVKKGFCNECVPGNGTKVAAAFDLSAWGYANVPEQFIAAEGDTPEVDPRQLPLPETEAADDEDEDEESDEDEDDASDTPDEPETETVPPQSAVAPNAEAAASRQRYETMTIKLIAQAIGLQADADESAVVAAVSRASAFVAELRSVTGAASADEILGAVRGFQAAAQQVPALKAQIEGQAKSLEAQERAALFAADAADAAGRKLTPAMQAFWSERPVAELKAFLAVAPHIVQTQSSGKQPEKKPEGDTEASAEVEKFEGKAWEEMAPAAKHNLHVDQPELYASLRNNWVKRGSPLPSREQRASA
jgi:ATP-dependent protease ClpP protease subunit